MPFNPRTFRFQDYPEISALLEKALAYSKPVFVSFGEDRASAFRVYWQAVRFRKAWEVCYPALDNGEHSRYTWLQIRRPEERGGEWGFTVRNISNETPTLDIRDNESMEPL